MPPKPGRLSRLFWAPDQRSCWRQRALICHHLHFCRQFLSTIVPILLHTSNNDLQGDTGVAMTYRHLLYERMLCALGSLPPLSSSGIATVVGRRYLGISTMDTGMLIKHAPSSHRIPGSTDGC